MHMPEIDFDDIDSRINKAVFDVETLEKSIKTLDKEIQEKTALRDSYEAVAKYVGLENQRTTKLQVPELFGPDRYTTLKTLLGNQNATSYTAQVDKLNDELKYSEKRKRDVEGALSFLNDDIVLLRKIQSLGGNPLLR